MILDGISGILLKNIYKRPKATFCNKSTMTYQYLEQIRNFRAQNKKIQDFLMECEFKFPNSEQTLHRMFHFSKEHCASGASSPDPSASAREVLPTQSFARTRRPDVCRTATSFQCYMTGLKNPLSPSSSITL